MTTEELEAELQAAKQTIVWAIALLRSIQGLLSRKEELGASTEADINTFLKAAERYK